jgi:hypothetical protein
MDLIRQPFKVVYETSDVFQEQHGATVTVTVTYQPDAPLESWLITAVAEPYADTGAAFGGSMGLVTAEERGFHLMYQSGTRTAYSLLEAAEDVGRKAFGNIDWPKGK